ncbi:uncharacterized protein LOC116248633 isoform X2 [Nymphaea colorata]|nr:uncharacterized protein LOC116248633 isoform X2 [Nymphaea colorata]
MRECVSLEKLPNKIYELSSLAVFNLEGCHKLVAFPQFLAGSDSTGDLHGVMNNQPTSRQLTNFMRGLSNLEELILRDCESLEFLPRLHEFHSLRSLHIDGCQGLNRIRKYLFENVAVREWDELSVSGSETQSSKQEFSFMVPIGSINDPLLLQQLQCHGYGDPCEEGTMTLHVRYEDIANNWLTLDTIFEARCDYSIYEDNAYGYCYTICFGRNDQINEAPRGETVIMKVTTVNNCKLTKVDIKLQKSSRFSGENMMKPYISISRREAFMSPPTSVNPSSSRKFEFEFSTFFSAYQADKLEVIEYSATLDARITQMMWRLHAQCGEQMFHFGWTIEELIILTLIFGDTEVSWYEQWHETMLPRQARDRVCHTVPALVKTAIYDKMKVLDISHCRFLVRTPDFARTPNLEKLILDHCGSLLEIGESIGQLKKLILLNITRCAKLLALPCAILQLNSLRVLSLERCSAIKFLPETCSRIWKSHMMHVGLEALQELVLDYCTLRGMPYYVGGLQCLRRLSLRGCYSLASLPLSIGSLVVLEELNVAECSKLFSIPGLEKLRSLKVVHMNGCDHLDLEQIHRQLKVFQDLEAFSISIATWNVINTSFLSPIDLGKSSRISFPFPRGGRVGREPLYVEQINVAIGGTLGYGRINLEIKTTEENVLHVDALPLSKLHVDALPLSKRSSRDVSKFEAEQLSAKTQAPCRQTFLQTFKQRCIKI